MTIETLLVTILAVLPGYVGLLALRFLTADDDVATWETVARSLIIGAMSAPVLLVPLDFLDSYRGYVFGSVEPTIDVLWGVLSHMASAVAISVGLAKALTSRRVQRLGRSVFHSAWDWMWFRTAKHKRHVMVKTEDGTFVGPLAFAGTLRRGGGIVIKIPMVLTSDGRLTVTGADFLLLGESQIRYVQITSLIPEPRRETNEQERRSSS